jgi:hypothetical protein
LISFPLKNLVSLILKFVLTHLSLDECFCGLERCMALFSGSFYMKFRE